MLKVVELYSVEQGAGVLVGLVDAGGQDTTRLVAGLRICCGARVWTVTRVEPSVRTGVFGAWLAGDYLVTRGMFFRIVGDPMEQAEFSRSATNVIKLVEAMRSVDYEAFIAGCGANLEPLVLAAKAFKAVQDLLPSPQSMRSFEDGMR